MSSPIRSLQPSIPGPEDTLRLVLDNGITVLARANFNSPSVAIIGSLMVGSLHDQTQQLGLADFVANALMYGTTQLNQTALYDLLESAGASLHINGGTHTTGFNGKCLVEDLPMLLSLCHQILSQPGFPETQIEKLRAMVLTGLALREQDTAEQAGLAFDQLVYANHPYSRPDEGYPATVKEFQVEDLARFHQHNYGPNSMSIAVVGGVDPQKAIDQIAAVFENWKNPLQQAPPSLPPLSRLLEPASVRVKVADKKQSDLVVGAAGPPREAEEYLAAALGNSVLGQFGMMGRIGETLREKAGLAYYAYSSLSSSLGPAPWTVSAGVNPKNEEKAARLIQKELERITQKPVSENELADSKANFIGRVPLSFESNLGVAASLIHIEKHQLGLDYYQRYADSIQKIRREEVLLAMKSYLSPQGLASAIAGPREK